jgi:hypothetical protein
MTEPWIAFTAESPQPHADLSMRVEDDGRVELYLGTPESLPGADVPGAGRYGATLDAGELSALRAALADGADEAAPSSAWARLAVHGSERPLGSKVSDLLRGVADRAIKDPLAVLSARRGDGEVSLVALGVDPVRVVVFEPEPAGMWARVYAGSRELWDRARVADLAKSFAIPTGPFVLEPDERQGLPVGDAGEATRVLCWLAGSGTSRERRVVVVPVR